VRNLARFLSLSFLSVLTLFSGLIRFKALEQNGGLELVGFFSSVVAISTLFATFSFGNLWSVLYLSDRDHRHIDFKVLSLLVPIKNIAKNSVIVVPIIWALNVFFSFKLPPLLIIAVAFYATSQVATFSTTAYLRSSNREFLLASLIFGNNFVTTFAFFHLNISATEILLFISGTFNYFQWLVVLTIERGKVKLIRIDEVRSSYLHASEKARRGVFGSLNSVMFDVYWRLFALTFLDMSQIGVMQPALQYMLTVEPLIMHFILSQKNDSIHRSLNSGNLEGQIKNAKLLLVVAPSVFTLLVIFFAESYLQLFYGEEFIDAVLEFQIVLLSSFFRFLVFYLNMRLVIQNRDGELSKLASVSFILRSILTTTFVMYYGIKGLATALFLESLFTFIFTLTRSRK